MSVVCWSCPVVSARKHTRRGRPDNNAEEGLTRRKHNQSRRAKKVCKWGGGCATPNPPAFFYTKAQSIAKDEKVCKWGGAAPAPTPPLFFYSELSAHESREEMHKSVFANTHERLRGFNAKKTQSIAKDEKVCKWVGGCAPPPNPPLFFSSKLSAHESCEEMHKSVFANTHEGESQTTTLKRV